MTEEIMAEKKTKQKLIEDLLWKWFAVIIGVGLIQELQRWPLFKTFNLELTATFLFLSTLFILYWPNKKKSLRSCYLFISIFLVFKAAYHFSLLPYPTKSWSFGSVLLIYVPLLILIRLDKKNISFFDYKLTSFLSSLFWFCVLAIAVFPLLAWLNHYFQDLVFRRHYIGVGARNISIQGIFFLHLFFIALPEEFFFRGYLQEQLNKIYGRPFKLFGANFGHGLWITALLFALSHSLIALQWWHFAIFFPGIAFGWLKEKTGTVTSSALFHAASNTFAIWVGQHYR